MGVGGVHDQSWHCFFFGLYVHGKRAGEKKYKSVSTRIFVPIFNAIAGERAVHLTPDGVRLFNHPR